MKGSIFSTPDWQSKLFGEPMTAASALRSSAASTAPKPVTAPAEPAPTTPAAKTPLFVAVPNPPGLLQPGNIDLANRPTVKTPDGRTATVRSISVGFGDKTVLLPTVSPDGRLLSDEEAIQLYKQTGQHLGVFNSDAAADTYAQQLHLQQQQMYVPP